MPIQRAYRLRRQRLECTRTIHPRRLLRIKTPSAVIRSDLEYLVCPRMQMDLGQVCLQSSLTGFEASDMRIGSPQFKSSPFFTVIEPLTSVLECKSTLGPASILTVIPSF